jgi:hypothetical protein
MTPRDSVAGRRELLLHGFDESRIAGWLRSGRLVQVLKGVYSLGRDIDTRNAAMRAALVAAGNGSVITGRSACEEWGIVASPSDQIPSLIQVAVTSGRRRTLHGASPALRNTRIKIVRRDFEPGEYRARTNLSLVAPPLALIDFAADASEREVRFAFLEACRLRYFGRSDVDYCHGRLVGRRGAVKVRPLLALWVPELGRIRSVLEGRFLLDWVPQKLPMPMVNVKVHGWEVDLYWPDVGLVVELDGGAFHNGPISRARDRAKTSSLEGKELTVQRITWADYDANPAAIIGSIAELHESLKLECGAPPTDGRSR